MARLGAGLLAALALLLPPPAFGAEPSPGKASDDVFSMSLEELGAIKVPKVYAASKREQEATDAPSWVSVITSREIQHMGYRTLADVLNSVPSLYATYNRGYHFLGVRGLNLPGDYGGRNLILLDGHRLNEPLFDSAFLGNDFILNMDLVDRVEVIQGPGSVMYGNNALFSVVNVISKRGADYRWGEVSVDGGSLESYRGRVTLGHRFTNGVEFVMSGSLMKSRGERRVYFPVFDDGNPLHNGGVAENLDREDARQFFTQWRYGDFTLEGAYSSRFKAVPHDGYEYSGTVFNARYDTTDDQAFADLKFERALNTEGSVLARVNFNRYVYDSFSVGDWSFTGDPAQYVLNYDWARARWLGAEIQASQRVFDRLTLTGGAEYRVGLKERYQNEDLDPEAVYASVDQSTSTWGVFTDAELQLWRTNLTFDAGFRYDQFSTFDAALSPRASLIARPWPGTTVKLLYGQAYRVPNVYEYNFVWFGTGVAAGLRPETIRSYEAMIEQRLGSGLRATASGYFNDVKDVISRVRDFGVDPNDPYDDSLQVINRHIASHGLAFELEAAHACGLRGRASYAWQQSRDEGMHSGLNNSPMHMAKLGLDVPLWRDKVFGGLQVRYQSAVSSIYSTRVPSFCLVDLTLFGANLAPGLDLSASIYNLLDDRHSFPGSPEHTEDRIPQLGRTFRLKLNYRF